MFCLTKQSIVLLFLSFFLASTHAESPVQLQISDKTTANGNFYPGDDNKPVILILHGFMLTHNFPIVKRLAESLNESGYSVLTPTLSLDISKRKKSLACEAVHTHSLERDVLEVKQWLYWLKKKFTKKIILIGHSIGSLHLAYLLSQQNNNNIQQVIFITLPDLNIKKNDKKAISLRETAQQLLENGDHSLHEFELLYCRKYPTPAENFLSYTQLSRKNIRQYLSSINVDKSLIIGSADKIINQQWNKSLTKDHVRLIQINGADHFFDGEYEFDLLDSVESLLIEASY